MRSTQACTLAGLVQLYSGTANRYASEESSSSVNVPASSTAACCSGLRSSAGTKRAPTAVMSMNGTGSAPRSRRSTVPSGCSSDQTRSKVSATDRETEVSPARLASRRNSWGERVIEVSWRVRDEQFTP